MSKFKISSKPTTMTNVTAQPMTPEQFVSSAAMVQSQTGGRPLKPIRVNFDLEPEMHRRLKMRAVTQGISVAQLVRQLIEAELAK